MADVVPFPCVRPRADMAREVASLPYDVYSLAEARAEIAHNPHSFLRIDMAEAMLPDSVEKQSDAVYEKAHSLLEETIADGIYLTDETPYYYLYRLCVQGRSQTGVVACSSIDDYQEGLIKKHEKTHPDKEIDRIKHVDTCNAQTGPIFLAFRSNGAIEEIMSRVTALSPLYDFEADDAVRHTIWCVEEEADAEAIRQVFAETEALYIADGHHRTASAVKAGFLRREAHAGASGEFGRECTPLESDHFLSVIFPSDQLTILDYNRVVDGLNGLSEVEFLEKVQAVFAVEGPFSQSVKPDRKGTFGMYVNNAWYKLTLRESCEREDPVSGLDVARLQDDLLEPILGIEDPRTSERIEFVGGIRGLEDLERRVDEGKAVAFSLYPTSIEELFEVADAGLLMPPKSTWFEPKLRSGLFIHRI